jgi:hypothetical protein
MLLAARTFESRWLATIVADQMSEHDAVLRGGRDLRYSKTLGGILCHLNASVESEES